ncbi:MAG: phage tail protein [Candidatus Reddybacter sp.]
MLLALGLFVFEVKTLPFQSRQRSTRWRWASNNRLGVRPAYQHLGQGDDQITLSGTLSPEITGGISQLNDLRTMADKGQAWVLMQGDGVSQGFWFIETIDETGSFFFADGSARKIDFTIQLKRADEGARETIGDLALMSDSLVNTSSFA